MASLRPDLERPFGAGSLLLSLGLHAAIVALVLAAGSYKFPNSPGILEVNLVAPAPGGDPIVSGKAAGGAAAPAAFQSAKKSPPLPRVMTKAKKRVPPARQKPRRLAPEPAPQVTAPKESTSPGAASTATPDFIASSTKSDAASGSGIGMSSTGAGSASGSGLGAGQGRGGQGHPGSGSGSLAAAQTRYLGLVRARILAHRRYPPLARARHLEGVVRLRFTLSNTGALSQGVQIVKPSGVDVLDEQASQCVLAAAPFPPFPPELHKNSLTVEVPIVYQLKDLAS
ncbi:MAG: TonB family protein [Deltaproteobacteria bacterium]|nr:TonB family protein [Deltaproteobacteria bacterium]